MAEAITGLLKSGNKAIATTGTAVALSTAKQLVNGVLISAPAGNSGIIYVGDSNVTNTAGASGNGYGLPAGKDLPLPMVDLSQVYINGTAGDYVTWVAI